jgi:predicted enzyme related to lactoylglutathione lyase
MTTPPSLNLILLFVDNPLKSAEFHSTLFGIQPVEQSPTFALFKFPNDMELGLWSRHTAEPIVTHQAGAAEISFEVSDIDALYAQWKQAKAPMLQELTPMDFGRTFVALDPDGHRLRVFTRNKE